ncbi:hypothetical protein Dimus_000323 [Dionaea muscipula]
MLFAHGLAPNMVLVGLFVSGRFMERWCSGGIEIEDTFGLHNLITKSGIVGMGRWFNIWKGGGVVVKVEGSTFEEAGSTFEVDGRAEGFTCGAIGAAGGAGAVGEPAGAGATTSIGGLEGEDYGDTVVLPEVQEGRRQMDGVRSAVVVKGADGRDVGGNRVGTQEEEESHELGEHLEGESGLDGIETKGNVDSTKTTCRLM